MTAQLLLCLIENLGLAFVSGQKSAETIVKKPLAFPSESEMSAIVSSFIAIASIP
jgi:hypothetical protein